ncbi:PaaX family transcriptional regulator C-terminal domain-containing protein [Paracoccus sulfuroxidans]|uniref:PaaX family transcriptional regulator n=1 Tax=Paracoccus sulfuroxidans TaxID=384678 RepID=A0A562NUU9_9RHOB|nr:PaaX family transcriptional regulator C-terminal domain-containing protein [Paracoccus sulfuroxidans]TWI35861.1 PaaX family transcriptional regulator [Paracoccus sulfuroxidans]
MQVRDSLGNGLGILTQVDQILTGSAPRATRFIVTVYGDVVEPRGGTLWMGTLIETCAKQGISESLARTAVSRLVSAGQLVGERDGRRSFYRLTALARREFVDAARVLFAPPPHAKGWLIAQSDGAVTSGNGWAKLSDALSIAPDRMDLPQPEGLVMRAEAVAGAGHLPDLAASYWDIAAIADGYAQVNLRYQPLCDAVDAGYSPDGAQALALRLRLVDDYRAVALRDPRLPLAALGEAWPGLACRKLFVKLYRALSPAADAFVGESFLDSTGPLLAVSEGSGLRLERLGVEAQRLSN